MPETFGDVWSAASVAMPAVDPLLVRQWTLDAYRRACAGRRWGGLRTDTRFRTLASRTLTATVTQGDATVTGTFVATDVNRQIRSGSSGLPYTILEVADDFLSAELDQTWQGSSGSATLTILDAFLFLPADFDGWRTLSNLTLQQPMPWWIPVEQIDARDPNRIFTDSTARLVAGRKQQVGGTLARRIVYEWYPYPTAAGVYDASYYRKPDPADGDYLLGAFEGRGYILRLGAQAEGARFPGTPDRRNPYYSLGHAQAFELRFEQQLQELSVRDDEILPGEQYQAVDWRWANGLIPFDTHLLRSTDADVGDYYGR